MTKELPLSNDNEAGKLQQNSHDKTTFGTVQKWFLRPLLNSPKGGLFLVSQIISCKNDISSVMEASNILHRYVILV